MSINQRETNQRLSRSKNTCQSISNPLNLEFPTKLHEIVP
jgi:hypothetical protein